MNKNKSKMVSSENVSTHTQSNLFDQCNHRVCLCVCVCLSVRQCDSLCLACMFSFYLCHLTFNCYCFLFHLTCPPMQEDEEKKRKRDAERERDAWMHGCTVFLSVQVSL